MGLRSTDPNSWAAPPRLLELLFGMSPCRTQAWSQVTYRGRSEIPGSLVCWYPGRGDAGGCQCCDLRLVSLDLEADARLFGLGEMGLGEAGTVSSCSATSCAATWKALSVSSTWGQRIELSIARRQVARCWCMIQGAIGTMHLGQDVLGVVDSERAGIAMLHY